MFTRKKEIRAIGTIEFIRKVLQMRALIDNCVWWNKENKARYYGLLAVNVDSGVG